LLVVTTRVKTYGDDEFDVLLELAVEDTEIVLEVDGGGTVVPIPYPMPIPSAAIAIIRTKVPTTSRDLITLLLRLGLR
jgi:hypothetical protein